MKRAAATDPAQRLIYGEHRRDTELEAWICERLKVRDLFDGDTTREIRRDRLTVLLEQRKITDSHAGKIGGKSVTWRELVTKLYPSQQRLDV